MIGSRVSPGHFQKLSKSRETKFHIATSPHSIKHSIPCLTHVAHARAHTHTVHVCHLIAGYTKAIHSRNLPASRDSYYKCTSKGTNPRFPLALCSTHTHTQTHAHTHTNKITNIQTNMTPSVLKSKENCLPSLKTPCTIKAIWEFCAQKKCHKKLHRRLSDTNALWLLWRRLQRVHCGAWFWANHVWTELCRCDRA